MDTLANLTNFCEQCQQVCPSTDWGFIAFMVGMAVIMVALFKYSR